MSDASLLPALSDRAIIRLAGADVRSFLQGIITQDIENLTPENAIFAALLTPQGKILFDFFVVQKDDAFFIDCFSGAVESLTKRLTLYRMRADVSIEIDADLIVVASENEITEPDALVFRDPRLAALGYRAIIKCDSQAADNEYKQRRIRLGVPEIGSEFETDSMFLLDVNYDALNAVSYSKGCFVGQEVTSRMKRKSEVRKRTLVVTSLGGDLETGAAIKAGDSTLGEILSGDGDTGLALIRLDRLEAAASKSDEPNSNGAAVSLSLPDYLDAK